LKPIHRVLLAFCAATPVHAQQPTSPPPAPRPDIEFAADVHMESLRFDGDPRARVGFEGGPRLEPRHDVEREGLPRPVNAGTTYRNVTVRTTISATLLDPALDATPAPAPTAPTPEDRP
jgi:hypothetical protein